MSTPKADFKAIEQMIQKLDFANAKKAMTVLKREGLTNENRFQFSLWYFRMGLPDKALHILKSELSEEMLGSADFEALRLQARLAFVLSYLGAKNYAQRILNHLQPYLEKNKEFKNNFGGSYYSYCASVYLRTYQFAPAEKYLEAALGMLDRARAPYVYVNTQVALAYASEGQGNVEKALRLAAEALENTQPDQKFMKGVCHLALGEFCLRSDDFFKAQEHFGQSENCFDTQNDTLDFGFLRKWQGVLAFEKKEYSKAQELFLASYNILNKKCHNPAVLVEILFWLHHIRRFCAPSINTSSIKTSSISHSGTNVAMTHPSRNPLSVVLGQRWETTDPPMHPWLKRRFEIPGPLISNSVTNTVSNAVSDSNSDSAFDVWVSFNGEVSPRRYTDIVNEPHKGTVVDLVAGLIWSKEAGSKNKVPDPCIILPELRARFMNFVWGCGTLGANFWGLADFLYPHEQCDLNFVQMRIKELIKQVRKLGFDIELKDQKVYWIPEPGCGIVSPMNLVYGGISAHFAAVCSTSTFLCKDLEKRYQTPSRTASRWVSQWLEFGLISAVEFDSQVPRYQFIRGFNLSKA